MDDLRYIFNKPIPLKGIGNLSAMTIDEYIEYGCFFNVLSITIKTILQTIDTKDEEKRAEVEKTIKAFDIVCMNPTMIQMLVQLLAISFKCDDVEYSPNEYEIHINYPDGKVGIINRENYDFVRNNIIKVNNIHLPKQAKTKELQEWFDRDEKYKAKQVKSDFEDVITAVMAYTHYTPEQLLHFTMYQINKLIERIIKLTEYESNVQFLCAGAENIKLDSWLSSVPDNRDKPEKLDDFVSSFSF